MTEPTKAHGLLPIWKKGKDSKKPSMRSIRTPLGPAHDLRLARGLPSRPSTAPRVSVSLEGSEPILERAAHLRLARGHPLAYRTNGQPLLHSAQDRWRQAAILHSGCDRSSIRQLRSLLRHPRHCSSTVGPATRDKTGSALLPLLFCLLRPSGLYLIIRIAPGPPPAREGVRCRHEPLEEG